MLKPNIYEHCLQLAVQNTERLHAELKQITEAANHETKSTAGDKHETARAMMQLEQEKLGLRLKEAEDQLAALKQTDLRVSNIIVKGSLVECDNVYFFVAVGLGKIVVEEKTIFVISPQSPLGSKLIGLRSGDTASLNGKTYLIRAIL